MDLLDVYTKYQVSLHRASGCHLFDERDNRYLDFYGGHGVISIGHSHPVFVKRIHDQLERIAFYSNAVASPEQERLAEQVGVASGYDEFRLFLCNSGAEAIENAVKIASFSNKRTKLVALTGGFHGRTSVAVALSDNDQIKAPVNQIHQVVRLPLNATDRVYDCIDDHTCAVVVEGIQGIAGVFEPSGNFLARIAQRCRETGAYLIMDEIQSGCGRTGRFFAHQHDGVKPDLITMAKGMGNGFPVAGVLVHPGFEVHRGMLGTTFGGGYLACQAASAVLDVMADEHLMENAASQGEWLKSRLRELPGVVDVRGRGLMLGVELSSVAAPVRTGLLNRHQIFTGSASCLQTLRLLPPLCVTRQDCNQFLDALKHELDRTLVERL